MRCRPGDLAVVIEGANTGAFVDVLRRGDNHPRTGEPAWECRTKADMRVTHVDMKRRKVIGECWLPAGATAHFCDTVLWPIRPPRTPMAIPAPPQELELTP
jgi:hypothetical protein